MKTDPDLELPAPPAPERRPSIPSRTVAVVGLSLLIVVQLFMFPLLALLAVFAALWTDLSTWWLLAPWGVALVITIGLLVQVARRRWRPAVALIAVVATLGGFAAIPVEGKIAASHICSPERRAVLLAVPPYAGAPAVAEGMGQPCGYALTTRDDLKQVVDYYRRQLADAGWQVGPVRIHRPAGVGIGAADVVAELEATRDGQRLTLEVNRTADVTTLQLLAW